MIIGLTGGIASGKSTAAQLFEAWGAYVIDADKLGHRAYLAGTQAFDQVVATFGADVVGNDGEVDRKALGGKVFGSGNRLDELTAIVWPAIRALAEIEIAAAKKADPNQIVVLEAAVMIEAGWQSLVDELWVTIVDPHIAIERACRRDGLSPKDVQDRIDAQLSNAERQAAAQVVITNNSSPEEFQSVLKTCWNNIN